MTDTVRNIRQKLITSNSQLPGCCAATSVSALTHLSFIRVCPTNFRQYKHFHLAFHHIFPILRPRIIPTTNNPSPLYRFLVQSMVLD